MEQKKPENHFFCFSCLWRIIYHLIFNSFRFPELQVEVLNQRLQFIVVIRVNVPGGLEEGDAVFLGRFPCGLRLVADEPVGDVDVILQVFRCRVLL